VRIITATNKDLQREIAEHRFREDLFYRLNVINIHLPPLRGRRDDIPLLAMYFLKVYAEKNQKDIEGFSEDAMHALSSYDWPGNVRELENAVERAVVFSTTKIISLSVLPQIVPALREASPTLTFKIGMPWRDLERQAIETALAHTRGNKPLAARLLGIAPRTVYRYLHRKERGQEPERDLGEFKDVKTIAAPVTPKNDPGKRGEVTGSLTKVP
jgi:two-component system response regulator HydG